MAGFARTVWLLVLGASLVLAPAPVVAACAEVDPAERVACAGAVPDAGAVRAPVARPAVARAVQARAPRTGAPPVPDPGHVRLHVLLCVWRE